MVNHELEHRLTRALRAGRTPVQPAPPPARNPAPPARVVVMAAPAEVAEVTIGNKAPIKKKRATIARRAPAEAVETDGTVTPRYLAERLGHFDCDPCSNARSHIAADRRYAQDGSHTHGTDGLSPDADWSGRVFLNNPWSFPMPWMLRAQRALVHGGCIDLVVLCKLDTGTEAWHTINAAPARTRLSETSSPELWHFHKRIQFEEHPAVVERRRAARVGEAISSGGETDPAKLGKITGKSTANFCSAIIHHRSFGCPVLDLADIATRYTRAST